MSSQLFHECQYIIFRNQTCTFRFSRHILLKLLHSIHSGVGDADIITLHNECDTIAA